MHAPHKFLLNHFLVGFFRYTCSYQLNAVNICHRQDGKVFFSLQLSSAVGRVQFVLCMSGIKKRPLVGGFYTSPIVIPIGIPQLVSFIERLSAGGRVRYGRFHCIWHAHPIMHTYAYI